MTEVARLLPPKNHDSFPIFLPSGQSVRVFRDDPDGKQGSVVTGKHRRLALAAGCIEVGTAYDDDDDEQGADSTASMIVRGIETILKRDLPDEIEGDGRPKLGAIKSEVGFNVTRAQLNAAWIEFEKTLA